MIYIEPRKLLCLIFFAFVYHIYISPEVAVTRILVIAQPHAVIMKKKKKKKGGGGGSGRKFWTWKRPRIKLVFATNDSDKRFLGYSRLCQPYPLY